MSNIKIIASSAEVLGSPETGYRWSWYYRTTEPVNGVGDGTYERMWTDPPELEVSINADFPGKIAERLNSEASTDQFTGADVFGGRL